MTGSVTIEATASDNQGVARVAFCVDGAFLSSDTAAPYAAIWDSLGVANGAHSLTTKAYDQAGNSDTSSVVSVSVQN